MSRPSNCNRHARKQKWSSKNQKVCLVPQGQIGRCPAATWGRKATDLPVTGGIERARPDMRESEEQHNAAERGAGSSGEASSSPETWPQVLVPHGLITVGWRQDRDGETLLRASSDEKTALAQGSQEDFIPLHSLCCTCVVHHFVKDYFTADIFLFVLSECDFCMVLELLSQYLILYLKK